jgi:hypothetical protein
MNGPSHHHFGPHFIPLQKSKKKGNSFDQVIIILRGSVCLGRGWRPAGSGWGCYRLMGGGSKTEMDGRRHVCGQWRGQVAA